jgi:hypothetical protein
MRNAVKMSTRRRGLLGHSMEGAAVPGPRRVRPAWSSGCSPRSGCSTRSLRPMAAATRSLPTSVRPDRVTAGGGPPEGNFRWSAARPNSAMRLAGGWDRPRPHRPGLVSAASQPSIFIQPRYGPGARRDPPTAAIGGTEAHGATSRRRYQPSGCSSEEHMTVDREHQQICRRSHQRNEHQAPASAFPSTEHLHLTALR